jgi:acetate kinase
VKFSANANQANDALISTQDSQIAVRVIATDEEAMIAHHVVEVVGA